MISAISYNLKLVITRPIYKPHSVQKGGIPEGTTISWMSISLGDTFLHRSCSLPGTQMRRAASCPCLTLLRMGVAWPPALLPAPVVSYTTFSPSLPRGSGFFLWPYQQLRLTARHSGCYPASCPVECGLSSISRRRPRSSDQPDDFIILL